MDQMRLLLHFFFFKIEIKDRIAQSKNVWRGKFVELCNFICSVLKWKHREVVEARGCSGHLRDTTPSEVWILIKKGMGSQVGRIPEPQITKTQCVPKGHMPAIPYMSSEISSGMSESGWKLHRRRGCKAAGGFSKWVLVTWTVVISWCSQ